MLEFLASESSLTVKLLKLCHSKENADKKTVLVLIRHQLKEISFLEKKSGKRDMHILRQAAECMEAGERMKVMTQLGILNSSQEAVLLDSLRGDFKGITEGLHKLKYLLHHEEEAVRNNNGNLPHLLTEEQKLIDEIMKLVGNESELQKKVPEHIEMAMHLEHREWFRSLIRGTSKLIMGLRFNVIMKGGENIPTSGPVVVCPRHYHGDYDPLLLSTIMKRKVFFLGAMDWMKEGAQFTISKIVFEKYGVVPINRPDSIFEKSNHMLVSAYKSIVRLLMLNQVVVIFPEGYGFVDSHFKKRQQMGEFLEIKAGVFHFVDYVQKKRNIQVPIIPVGTRYEGLKEIRGAVVVNVGKPIYLPITEKKIDYDLYKKELQHQIEILSKM